MTLKELNPQPGDCIYKKSWNESQAFIVCELQTTRDFEIGVSGFKMVDRKIERSTGSIAFLSYDLEGDWVKFGNVETDPVQFKMVRSSK